MKQATIDQYLIPNCLTIIDELNEQYGKYSKHEMLDVSNNKFNELDITYKIGFPFKQMAHYSVRTDQASEDTSKSNHDIYIESKDFQIEVKYLKNWGSGGSTGNSAVWKAYKSDFDWLFKEIDKGKKHKRAFVIGWFRCIEYFGRCVQIGVGGRTGCKPLVDANKERHFPFLYPLRAPTQTKDLAYNYDKAYEVIPVSLIGRTGNYDCIFLGNEEDVFHFAIYF